MDFSYLDKDSYQSIPLWDETNMNPLSENNQFFIRRYKATEFSKELHRHKYIQINYVNKGSGYHIINNQRFDIFKGDIFIIPPFVPHTILLREDVAMEIFEFEFSADFILNSREITEDSDAYLDFAYLEPFMVVEECVKPRFNLSEKLQIEVEAILNEALTEYQEKGAGYMLLCKALLLKLLVITGRAYSEEIKGTKTETILNKYKNTVLESLRYIDENFDKNISLREIAHKVCYSSSHFSYLFKAVTGQTFIEYLSRKRIEKAIELLNHTDMNITDISYAVGFNTISNFNKTFKYFTGQTPRAYKK